MDLIGFTLGRYLTIRFVRMILSMFLTVVALIYTIDFVELMRRSGDVPGIRTSAIALLTLYRTPSVAEQVMPFAILFGAMATMLGLSRKLELVIMRSAGVSVWEFLQPPLFVALFFGILSVAVYNPVSAKLKQQATDMEASLFGRGARALAADLWIRQRSIDGQAIIRALSVDNVSADLKEVTFFQFDQSGQFLERVEAKTARIGDGFWELNDVRLVSADAPPETYGTYMIATNLRPEQIRQSIVPPNSVPFWDLPDLVERTERAGLDATRYKLQYQVLLARPLLLVA
ncbi:MAG: LptF/LptG family permease, partial [Beijerinckiaceae bacterium]